MVEEPAKIRPTKMGVLIVHGIGEQKRFETARSFARSLATTLRTQGEVISVVDRSEGLSLDELACPSPDPDASPFKIVIEDGASTQSLHIHEVWWADIGKDKGFWADVKFWFWALGQWGAQFVTFTHFQDGPSNTDILMKLPTFDPNGADPFRDALRNIYARFLLALWGFAAFLTFFSWSALKWVASWLSPYVGSPSIISDYVDRVRIYTQGVSPEGGSLVDMGRPWRATIRRRMVAELVAMAERDYDYWYVLAHSQGSVLAFNSIEEPEWSLPNHLQPRQFFRLRQALRTLDPYDPPGAKKPDLTRMMPARPTWLVGDAGISRPELFKTFRGLLTYGSPLDKFAALWPRIVCLNKQGDVFPDARWVNLWDAHDPIGASLSAFSTSAWPNMSPMNVHTRASPWFLLAHIEYFQPNSPEMKALLKVLCKFGHTPASLHDVFNEIPDAGGGHWGRWLSGIVQSLVLIAALSALAGLLAYSAKGLIGSLFPTILQSAPDVWPLHAILLGLQDTGTWIASLLAYWLAGDLWSAVRFVWFVGAITVILCGVVRAAEEYRTMKRG